MKSTINNKALNKEINEFVKGKKSDVGIGTRFVLWFGFLYLLFQISRVFVDYSQYVFFWQSGF